MKFPKLPSLDNIATITAAEIQMRKARASNAVDRLSGEMIRLGRGSETPLDTAQKTDPLSVADTEARYVLRKICEEIRARKECHGSAQPIRRMFSI